jgi:hypothetical protein
MGWALPGMLRPLGVMRALMRVLPLPRMRLRLRL